MRLGKKIPPYPILNKSLNMSSYKNSNFSFSYELEETKDIFRIKNTKIVTNSLDLINIYDFFERISIKNEEIKRNYLIIDEENNKTVLLIITISLIIIFVIYVTTWVYCSCRGLYEGICDDWANCCFKNECCRKTHPGIVIVFLVIVISMIVTTFKN